MKIELHHILVRDLVEGYVDNDDDGAYCYGGKLNIRPPYQRSFIYKDKERKAVIDTVYHGFPLNVMYWNVCGDGTFEIIDGQQRTISICQFYHGVFSSQIDGHLLGYINLQDDQREKILNYELMVYQCTGEASERLKWFQTINIAGKELTKQEMRNAIYVGPFVTDAKKKFSSKKSGAYEDCKTYLNGAVERQEYLETVLKWFSKGDIDGYMSTHQNDPNANELWIYFRAVMEWIKTSFGPDNEQKANMRGLDWGMLYDQFKDAKLVKEDIDREYNELIVDDDVQNKKGIYPYILTRDERYLNLRLFTDGQKKAAYKKQDGICAKCGKHFELREMEADHINPWSKGGKTVPENCQMLCKDCNRRKSNK